MSPVFSIPVVINPLPVPGFILPEVCLSDAYAQFTDTSSISSGSIVSWSWNFGDPASGPLNTSTLQHPQHRYNAIGVYTVTLTVTSNSGCVVVLSQQITVNGDTPLAGFNTLNPATLCANDSVAIQNTSTAKPANFYVILDEAHRGMTENRREREQANSLVQRLIKGYPEVGLQPVKLIIGMSATP